MCYLKLREGFSWTDPIQMYSVGVTNRSLVDNYAALPLVETPVQYAIIIHPTSRENNYTPWHSPTMRVAHMDLVLSARDAMKRKSLKRSALSKSAGMCSQPLPQIYTDSAPENALHNMLQQKP